MPVLSGIESTREIRQLEKDRREKGLKGRAAFIVALTGLAAESDRREAFGAGVDEFMVKPVNFGVLRGVLDGEWRRRSVGGGKG
jgi:CheY-like chemotaxis protein